MDDSVLRKVAETAVALSGMGEGAILAVGEFPTEHVKWSETRYDVPVTSIQDIDPCALAECAKLDGATFISQTGYIRRYNVKVKFTPEPDPLPEVFDGRGSRHETAVKLAYTAPGTVVVVVSENGGISIVSASCAEGSEETEPVVTAVADL